jgi:hypothetical protein
MKTCTKCGGNAYSDFNPMCEHVLAPEPVTAQFYVYKGGGRHEKVWQATLGNLCVLHPLEEHAITEVKKLAEKQARDVVREQQEMERVCYPGTPKSFGPSPFELLLKHVAAEAMVQRAAELPAHPGEGLLLSEVDYAHLELRVQAAAEAPQPKSPLWEQMYVRWLGLASHPSAHTRRAITRLLVRHGVPMCELKGPTAWSRKKRATFLADIKAHPPDFEQITEAWLRSMERTNGVVESFQRLTNDLGYSVEQAKEMSIEVRAHTLGNLDEVPADYDLAAEVLRRP